MTLLLAVLLGASAAHPCGRDAERLCKDVQPGEGRIVRCMKAHEAELSPSCKQRIATFREEVHAALEACNADVEKFCGGMERGEGHVHACLMQHEAELSPGCKAAGEKLTRKREGAKATMQSVNEACKDDLGKFCKNVRPGGGRLAQCLRQYDAELSPGCSSELHSLQK
jgi:Golgi apparatus protein 1